MPEVLARGSFDPFGKNSSTAAAAAAAGNGAGGCGYRDIKGGKIVTIVG